MKLGDVSTRREHLHGTAETLEVDAGHVVIPIDHDAPTRGSIEIAYRRIPAREPVDPGRALVYLAGGPGESGIDDASWDPVFQGLRAVSAHIDVLVLDQRGTGRSRPLLETPLRWGLPLDRSGDDQQDLPIVLERLEAMRAYWTDRAIDLGLFTTPQNADDVAFVSEALGYDRMVLLGSSYGSHLGLNIVHRHGDRVERAILGLIEGPDHTNKLPALVQAQLECIGTRFSPPQNEASLLEQIERACARLEPGVVASDEVGQIVVGPTDLRRALAGNLGQTSFMWSLAGELPGIGSAPWSWLAADARASRTGTVGNAMSWIMDAASGASSQRRRQIELDETKGALGNACAWPMTLPALDSFGVDLGEEYRAPVESDVPTLLVSGELDIRTAPQNATEVAATLPNSRQITIADAAHLYGWIGIPAASSAVVRWIDGDDIGIDRIEPGAELTANVAFD